VYVSAFDLYRVGPGPSSTYTGIPQRAALRFIRALAADGVLAGVDRVEVELYGGLAFLGREHATDAAIVAGLAGEPPERCDAAALARSHAHAEAHGLLAAGGRHRVRFAPSRDIRRVVHQSFAGDGNAVCFLARDVRGASVATRMYFAGGDGSVCAEDEIAQRPPRRVPYPFASAAMLAEACRARGKRIQDLARANECALASPDEVQSRLTLTAQAMRASVERGLATDGALPGGRTRVARTQALAATAPAQRCAAFATAVGEENAAGGTIVTAPSAGAAGPVAALLHHWRETGPWQAEERTRDFLLAAAAVGGLLRASGMLQVGCQGEIGVAAAMAAAGFAAANDASCAQALFAAERALEPHLGLACDLADGRVEDPCIERGARAAARACDAAAAALRLPQPRVGLDTLTRALVESGRGMTTRPKSASIGGLAVNVVEC